VQFRILGRLEIDSGGRDLTPARPKQRALVVRLLLQAGDVVATDDLIEALWGDHPPPTAPTALHGHVSAVRKVLGSERLETRPGGYRLRLLLGDQVDAVSLERLLERARSEAPVQRMATLAEALALFRGEPLSDFRYEPFASSEAIRLEELHLATLEDELETELELGRHKDAIARLRALVATHGTRERLHGLLMLALYRDGRQAEALEAFRDARTSLLDELGLEPGPALSELERRILNHDPTLAAAAPATQAAPVPDPSGIVVWLCVGGAVAARAIVGQHGAQEVSTEPDTILAAFARARDAAAAALAAMRAAPEARIGIDATQAAAAVLRPVDGRGARTVAAAAHAGQVLVSQAVRDLLRESGASGGLRDAGCHRLRDLGSPWRLFELAGPSGSAVSRTPRSLAGYRTNLPSQATSLVGRDGEMSRLTELLRQPDLRLVTVTGAAGVGKTRLAVQTAARLLDDFRHAVLFVDLAPIADVDVALQAIASTVGAPVTGNDAAAEVARHLATREILLVLDNLEHLPGLAPPLDRLIPRHGGSKLLATSRSRLRVPLEHELALEPLATRDAIELFTARARAARPGFALGDDDGAATAAICRALDGLPLALELAASQLAVLPPAALRRRLDHRLAGIARSAGGRTDRHATLEAAIDWSYRLLDANAQQLLASLSAFARDAGLEAIEAVCGETLDVVDGLGVLVQANLVRVGGTDDEPRFGLLETVRRYGLAALDASHALGEARDRHAAYFLGLAERAEPHLREDPAEWLARLDADEANLRAALDHLEAAGDNARFVRLAGALWRYWYLRGRLSEGRRRLSRAAAVETRATPMRAKALLGATVMTGNSDDYAATAPLAEETIAVSREIGDAWTEAYAIQLLGNARGRLLHDGAETLFRESAARFRALGDEHSALLALRNLARILEFRGKSRAARSVYEQNLRDARRSHNPRIEASTLGTLALIAADEGRDLEALSMMRQSLTEHLALGDLLDGAVDLCGCAYLLARGGRADVAAKLLCAFEQLDGEIGGRDTWVAARNERAWNEIERVLTPPELDEIRASPRTVSLADALTIALGAL
jgi:predicted ATPase/DNA-binding SARP family transcriptional activator